MNNWRASIKTVIVLAAIALVPAAAAQAQPLENPSVQLQLNAALAKKLKKEDVRLVAIKPALAKGRSLTLPGTESSLEPQYGSGYLYLGGGFKWQAGKKVATLRRLILNIEKRALTAVVNGTTLKLAELPPQQLTLSSFDFTDALSSMKLTGRAASILNRRLGLQGVFKAGRSLGTATASGRFETIPVTGGEITLTVDDAFREKLQSVEADVRPTTLTIPIQGGAITSSLSAYVSGENGLAFVQSDTSPFGEPFERMAIGFITTGVSLEAGRVSGAANVANPRPGTFGYSGALATIPTSPVQFDTATGQATSSLPMALEPAMADLLNEQIGAKRGKPSLFSAGEPLGTVGFTARTR